MKEHLREHSYKRRSDEYAESCTSQMCLKLPNKLREKLILISGWQDKLRGIIEKMVNGDENH